MRIMEPLNREREARKREEEAYARVLAAFLTDHKASIIKPLLEAYTPLPDNGNKSFKATDKEIEKEIERLILKLDLRSFEDLPPKLQKIYKDMAEDGMVLTIEQFRDTMDEEAFAATLKLVNERAVQMAKDFSAQLVGKKWVDGELVDNPNAYWRIDESTREMIRNDVSTALQEGWTNERLAKELMDPDHAAFSSARAQMVARTEMADVDIQANQAAWRLTDMVKEKIWLLSSDPCELCEENAAVGQIGFDEDFPNGDPPVHPNCSCDVAAVVED